MSFETALTGLNAASADLDVTGNNVANSATTGFKSSRAEFADIYALSNVGTAQTSIGQGVRLAAVTQQFTQGQFDFTGNTLDLAVNGTGFFALNANGTTAYSRNGAFQLDRDGFIVDADGHRLNGYQAGSNGAISGALGDLQVNIGNVAPQATANIGLSANLDARAATIPTAFDAADPATYNFSTSTTVYDAQGKDHFATLYFQKQSDNVWDIYADGDDGTGAKDPATVTFDSRGEFVSATGATTYSFNYAGAGTSNISVDYSSLTQYGSVFDVKELSQDGFSTGQFTNLGVEDDGRLLARFTNGQSQTLGQIALSRFPSPQSLQQIGDTHWAETFASGAPVTAAPGSSGVGTIQGGALEKSNVNLTEQLVHMITAQRNFQANSQMISTQDQITQSILNIR
ncbi:flagellar hook protein FlgE [Nitrococcus mobilis]|uniref:Flagellar hook protein FlgE n=1 Tax=Nitrococcus mobilis Nb-231 TaxID=314278 RepID=A4BQF0_9GAMM|nr:flagellar hook protein FlgE [Nitrococcus mobilis]EAR22305.1 flagellar hook protein [Nitrococcus mobilis Nb-231]